MIGKLKDAWFIFKNTKDNFNKEKSYASNLIEKTNHLKCITEEAWCKNKEIVDFINENIEKYPNNMQKHLKSLVDLLRDYENKSYDYINALLNAFLACNDSYIIMLQKLENRDFDGVKECYKELIKTLKHYEEKYNIKIFDNSSMYVY